MSLSALLVPGLLLFVGLWGLSHRVDVYASLAHGAAEGLRVLLRIFPALVALLTAVSMLRASGAMDALAGLCAPVLKAVGIPPELVPLMLIRPFSGSAALAVGAELMRKHGVNSLVGRTAAVMLGSSETTFYIIGVYFGAAGVKKTRYTVPAAIVADLTGFFMASLSVRLFF